MSLTQRKASAYIAAILETLAESKDLMVGEGSMIASHIYLALGMDIHQFNLLRGIMTEAGLVTTTSEVWTITDKGREIVRQVAEAKKRAEGGKQ